jgi:RNA polymerase sigma factor (sigma-70 family)
MDARLAPAAQAGPRVPSVRLRFAGDERLAKLAGSGSEAAFTLLFQRFHQPLYRYCRSLLGDDADAQDALQTTFTQALVALREGRRTAPIRPWLYRIAHNESVSLLRRRRPMRELPVESVLASDRSPHEVMEERARLTTLMADLEDLPERQRGALVMRELSGLPHEEIAQALGISVGAAKQTVLEARRSLQEFERGRSMRCEEIQEMVSDGDRRTLRSRQVRAHLRDCAACRAFAGAIPARRAALSAASPALPVATAASILGRLTGTGSGHGGGGVSLAAGATGKAASVGAAVKTMATGAAIVAAAAIGGEIPHLAAGPAPRSPRAAVSTQPSPHVRTVSPQRHLLRAGRVDAPARGRPADHGGPAQIVARRPAAHRLPSAVAAAGAAAPVVASMAGRGHGHASSKPGRTAAAPSAHAGSRGASATAPGHTGQTGQSRAAAVRAGGPRRGTGQAGRHGSRGSPIATSHKRPVATRPHGTSASGSHGHAATASVTGGLTRGQAAGQANGSTSAPAGNGRT